MTANTRSNVLRPANFGKPFLAGAATFLIAVLAVQFAHAQTEKVAYSFRNGADGVYPSAGVVRDSAGNLYGTTTYGGAYGLGTVFKLSKHGKTTLYNFAGKDGAHPGNLIRDAAGNLYGITGDGGDLSCVVQTGCGTVFKLDTKGTESVLHNFTESSMDGGNPTGLTMDAKGNLFGTTEYGGSANVGILFKLDTAGKETVLYTFSGGTDGANPTGVIVDGAGNLYGTTSYGGAFTWGTVFKLNVGGKEMTLHSFASGADGGNPTGALVMDAVGNLYGTTSTGGVAGTGTLFEIERTGKESVLHSFSQPGDGGYPGLGLSRDSAGNLYGNTVLGGTYNGGTVFKYDALGNERVLHSFSGADGEYPGGALVLNPTVSGIVVYGTTQQGGADGSGAVFEIVP